MLRALNRRLLGRGDAQATCLALRIDADGRAMLANAGHMPPYLNGHLVAVEGTLPLGMKDGAEISVMRFNLKEQDRLVLLSDGVAEAMDADGHLFGFDEGVVFTGHILFHGGHPIVWAGPISNWIAACERILALEPVVVVPGHGPLGGPGVVADLKGYFELLTVEARQRFDIGMSAADAARDIDLGPYSGWSEGETCCRQRRLPLPGVRCRNRG